MNSDKIAKIRVLVTGSSGFIGQNLKSYFNKSGLQFEEIFRSKLLKISETDLVGLDIIIHLAGKAHDLKNVSDPDEYYQVNFELTKKLYDAFLQSDAKKFIFISSVKAVADVVTDILTEETDPAPQTDYGKSKLMAEQFIQTQPLPQEKSYYILRPCMVHGPGNKGNLNLLYNFVKKGIPYPLAKFNNKRSYLSVGNLCFVINQLIIREDIPGGIYNVSDDEPLSTNDVVTIIASSLGVMPRLWQISPRAIRLLAKVCDYLHLPLTTERLNKLTESYIVSNKKIKSIIKKELPLATSEGLKITADSFSR